MATTPTSGEPARVLSWSERLRAHAREVTAGPPRRCPVLGTPSGSSPGQRSASGLTESDGGSRTHGRTAGARLGECTGRSRRVLPLRRLRISQGRIIMVQILGSQPTAYGPQVYLLATGGNAPASP